MKITLRPYAKDTSRWQLDIRLMHPCHPERELRRRAVAPPGMDPKQARLWGERQVPSMLRALMGEPELPVAALPAPARKEVAPKTALTKAAPAMTLAEFYQQRFELSKLGKMLRFARKLRTIDRVPNIEGLPGDAQ